MKSVALFGVLLFALQSPGAPTAKSEEGRKMSGEPCSVSQLVGTWRLIEVNGDPRQDRTVLKHITPTHFVLLSADLSGTVAYSHSGPYTLNGDSYTESIKYGFGPPFEKIRGKSFTFKCSMAGGKWRTVGEVNGQPDDETWAKEAGEK